MPGAPMEDLLNEGLPNIDELQLLDIKNDDTSADISPYPMLYPTLASALDQNIEIHPFSSFKLKVSSDNNIKMNNKLHAIVLIAIILQFLGEELLFEIVAHITLPLSRSLSYVILLIWFTLIALACYKGMTYEKTNTDKLFYVFYCCLFILSLIYTGRYALNWLLIDDKQFYN
ncbi:hypothetical protein MUN86_26380 (plasmid) [Hymenobacter volaticus]|uniref:CPBP family intramembrane metalloprotease n=2 Tax=Hymenobacter volaticus TaxID=2932254 RepID=A0ABY4GDV7_9BACT|nr:hypothetical protein MUN86_26380 [Hymenobacter volaticus]